MTTKFVPLQALVIVLVLGALTVASVVPSAAEIKYEQTMPNSTVEFFRDALEELREFTIDEREDAVDLAYELLEELNSQIFGIEAKIDYLVPEGGGVLADELRNSLAALINRRAEVGQRVWEIQQTSTQGWAYVLDDFSSAFEGCVADWNKIMTELEKDVGSFRET